jgi:hypothetical protein
MVDVTIDEQGTVVGDELYKAGSSQANLSGQNFVAQGKVAVGEFIRQLSENSQAPQSSSFFDSSKANAVSFSCLNRCLSNAGVPFALLGLIGAACAVACAFTAGLGCAACLGFVLGGYGGVIAACLRICG